MNDISSVSVDGLNDLLRHLNSGSRRLSSDLDQIRASMRSNGVTLETLNRIGRIAEWVDDQIPGLERRRNLAIGLTGDQPSSTVVTITEPLQFASPEEAEQFGRELAQQLFEPGPLTPEVMDGFFEEFEPYVNDPDVMAGFYLEAGPERAELLPSYLEGSGTSHARRYLELFSIGLGEALRTTDNYSSTSDYYTEFAAFREHFRQPTDHPSQAGDRMAMLQYGDFPPRWLADVVHNSVLTHFEGDNWDNTDFRFGFTPRQALGLSEDTLVLAFATLSNNPSAARIALSEKADISLEEYVNRVYGLEGSIGTGTDIAEAFGQAIAAGTGALDEPADKGSHASAFAFEAILALGKHEVTPHVMRESIGEIAAAYAEELLVGSFMLDARDRESSMDAPENFDLPPGFDPAFYLSPEDVYRFIYGMGGEPEPWAAFDEAVEDLFQRVPGMIEADLEAVRGDSERADPRHFERALNMFGTLAGLQLEAQLNNLETIDEAEKERRRKAVLALNTALIIGAPSLTGVAMWGWRISQVATMGPRMDWVDSAGGRADEFAEAAEQAKALERLMIASMMLDAGYPHSEDIPESLLDADGNLRNPGEIAQDEELRREFNEWSDRNNVPEQSNMYPFDDKFDSALTDYHAGRDSFAETIAHELGWGP